jgi:hypothetical protein
MKKTVMIGVISAAALLTGACSDSNLPPALKASAGSTTTAAASSGYSPATGYDSSSSIPGYSSSSDIDDYGDAGCRTLNDLGATGDYETDQMSRAIRNNYCTSTGMRSNPDTCGALRDMPLSGDPETDRLRSSVLNNYC